MRDHGRLFFQRRDKSAQLLNTIADQITVQDQVQCLSDLRPALVHRIRQPAGKQQGSGRQVGQKHAQAKLGNEKKELLPV